MSRVSLNKRLLAMRDTLLQRDPLLAVLHTLTPFERRVYNDWRKWCDSIIAEYEEQAPGRYWEALINGEKGLWLPELRPKELREKIFGNFTMPPNDASLEDVADLYKDLLND